MASPKVLCTCVERLAALVKAGTLTQAQADAQKAAVTGGRPTRSTAPWPAARADPNTNPFLPVESKKAGTSPLSPHVRLRDLRPG